jgi:UDP-glucose 4-epimerase
VYNVGADQPFTLNELAAAVAGAMGVEPRVVYLAARHEVQDAHSTHERAAAAFGRGPAISLDEGLRKMAAWAKAHGARSGAPFKAIEVTQRLPPVWRTDG